MQSCSHLQVQLDCSIYRTLGGTGHSAAMENFAGKWKIQRGSDFEENVKEFALADGSTPEMVEMLKDMDVFFTLVENNGKWDWKMEIPGVSYQVTIKFCFYLF